MGRQRAGLDAVYGLPVVVCAGCGFACVRRRHPLIGAARRARRVLGAAGLLAVQLVVLTVLSVGLTVLIVSLQTDLHQMKLGWWQLPGLAVGVMRDVRFASWAEGGGRGDLAVWVVASVSAGVWLRAALAHWRIWALLAAWGLVLAGMLSCGFLENVANWGDGKPPPYRGLGFGQWLGLLTGAGLTVMVAGCGMPLGAIIARFYPWYHVWRFGRARARRRKLRAA